MAPLLDVVPPVDDRISEIAKALHEHSDEAEEHLPGLAKLLDTYLHNTSNDPRNDAVDREKFTRGLLQVFWKSPDKTYEDVVAKYGPEEQKQIVDFVQKGKAASDIAPDFVLPPSPACREEIGLMESKQPVSLMDNVTDWIEETKNKMEDGWHDLLGLKDELKEKGLHYHRDARFQNWGLTVNNRPEYTFVPKTAKDVQNIVKFAAAKKMSVRVSGYRHSWAPTFSENGQVLISLLDLETATRIPNTESLPFPESKPTDLQTIHFAPENPRIPLTGGKRLVRVGTAVTNERLRRWCIQNKTVTMPLNVIMVEITLGGSNGMICHGSGLQTKTVSDLVKRIEYIDAHGNQREIRETDTEWLKAASGCFGLLGVITHLTLELDPMTFAVMKPRKIPTALAIPPPKGVKIPDALNHKYSAKELQDALEDFERRSNDDYYVEYFWFPFSDYCWVNTWKNVTDDSDVVDYPSDITIFIQFISTVLLNVIQYTPVIWKLVDWAGANKPITTLLSRVAMLNLPDVAPGDKPIKTWLPDALHFQRAIQNIRVRDMEVEIELPASVVNPKKPDYKVVQQTWWDTILKVYDEKNLEDVPMRFPLEMRIMGSSDVIMAAQRGYTHGTCSIEILTLENMSETWQAFCESMLSTWMARGRENNVRIRPHWAKDWFRYSLDGKPWKHKVKNEDYKDEIVEFRRIMASIGKAHGWTLKDIKTRFSNPMWNELLLDGV